MTFFASFYENKTGALGLIVRAIARKHLDCLAGIIFQGYRSFAIIVFYRLNQGVDNKQLHNLLFYNMPNFSTI